MQAYAALSKDVSVTPMTEGRRYIGLGSRVSSKFSRVRAISGLGLQSSPESSCIYMVDSRIYDPGFPGSMVASPCMGRSRLFSSVRDVNHHF